MTIPEEGETIGLFEPLMVSEGSPARAGLNDLVLELAEKSAAFRSGLPACIHRRGACRSRARDELLLVTWDEIKPARFEAALAEAAQCGGVLRLSAAGLAEDAPKTFPTPKAAARWLESSEGKEAVNTPAPLIRYNISGAGVFNPRRVSLRLQGRKGRATPALVVLPGDARAMAEAQLGPLSMFEEQTGPVPKMSENPPPEPEEAVVAPYKKDPDPAELDFARAHKRAKVAEPKREAVRQEVRIARQSAAAQVARAIAGGATRPKEILTETGLPPAKAGTALRRMQEAGLVYEAQQARACIYGHLRERTKNKLVVDRTD